MTNKGVMQISEANGVKENAFLSIHPYAKKTEALKVMVEKMDESGAGLLLSHGCVRKSLKDGADLLRGKNTDQLVVPNADPVVARKVEIKLNNLMEDKTPIALQPIMEGVIEDATQYLGVHLVEPQLIKICKCMKNEFVQCELWCDEALRRVTKPPCTCSRHVSVQEIEELSPTKYLQICPGTSRAFPGVEIAVTECPKKNAAKPPCPAAKPTDECHSKHTTSYLMYSTVYNRNYGSDHPTRIPPQTSYTPKEFLDEALATKIDLDRVPPFQSLLSDVEFGNKSEQDQSEELNDTRGLESHSTTSVTHQSRSVKRGKHTKSYPQASTTTCPQVYTQGTERQTPSIDIEKAKTTSNYSCRTPILTVSTDQMGDWHAMMVSLMWNVQAWRKWIRENIDAGLAYVYDPNKPTDETADSWISFQKRVTTEALQWRQYNIFSRQLTLRLVSRYSNKEILSPSRATVKTECYEECASEMIDIIDMFNRWTQWLVLVVKEAGSLVQTAGPNISLQAMRWNHYKNKIVKYSNDWIKYNMHLNVGWEKKYQRFVPDYALNTNGPVWVVSACGAVPSGAVAGGMYNGEVIWIARTTHRCNVLPAALHPSNHCCLVYADGAVYHYTKYQVMCNAEVNWVPWRGGAVATLAIRVTKGVYIGRVLYRGSHLIGPVHAPHYRCHVVIFGRPFAFNCYEILALTKDSDQ